MPNRTSPQHHTEQIRTGPVAAAKDKTNNIGHHRTAVVLPPQHIFSLSRYVLQTGGGGSHGIPSQPNGSNNLHGTFQGKGL